MDIETLAIPDIKLVTPRSFPDSRGAMMESYSLRHLRAAGIDAAFVQDNESISAKAGTVRGLHFQIAPHAQGKLVRVVKGAILDVAVDIRRGSPTYGRHVAAELSATNRRQMWVPAGFAHGLCTREDDTVVLYKVTAFYAPDCERGLQWDDPALGIAWPVVAGAALLSEKDAQQPRLADLPELDFG